MTRDEAIAIAESIRNGERGIDEITLNRAESVLQSIGDSRVSEVHWLRVRQSRNDEWRAGCM